MRTRHRIISVLRKDAHFTNAKGEGNRKLKKIKRLLNIILSSLILTACTAPGSSHGYRQITVDEAVAMMRDEKHYIILDVRRPDEYAEGHIPGSINVPNETIGIADIPELPDKSQMILVYCRSGRRSKEASEKLVRLGYTNIVEFGGILDWKGEIEK